MPDFITESELKDFNETRQKEWERVRKPEDPIERPEVPVDSRPLWQQLKDHKEAKKEHEKEMLAFKNHVWKGMDDEEAKYYQCVAVAGSMAKDEIRDEVQAALKEGKKKAEMRLKDEMEIKFDRKIVVEKNVDSSVSKSSGLAGRFTGKGSALGTKDQASTSTLAETVKVNSVTPTNNTPPKPVKKVISNQKRRLASIVKVKNHPIKKSKLGLIADYSSSSSSSSDSESD